MANEQFGGPFPAYIASRQSIDFAALSAGVIEADVTVQGVSPGDGILVVKPATGTLTNSTQLFGYCDTADTVTVVLSDNDVTATDNFAAVTVTIIVFPNS